MTVIPGLWLLTSSSIFRFVGEGASTPLRLQCEERSLFCPSVERAAGEVVTKIQLLQCLDRYQKQCYTACFFLLCAAVETATDLFGAMRTVCDDLLQWEPGQEAKRVRLLHRFLEMMAYCVGVRAGCEA